MGTIKSAALALAAAAAAAALCGAAKPAAPGPATFAAARPTWRIVFETDLPAANFLSGITAPGPRSAWAIGHLIRPGSRAIYAYWNGTIWRQVSLPGAPLDFTPRAIQSTATTDVWIFGQGSAEHGLILNWDGRQWRHIAEPPGANGEPAAVLGRSDAWTMEEGGCTEPCTVLHHWNGSSWLSSQVPFAVYDLVPAGRHALALTFTTKAGQPEQGPPGRPVLYERTGGTWRRMAGPGSRLADATVAGQAAGRIWLWGYLDAGHTRSVLYKLHGSSWSAIDVPAGLHTVLPLLPDGRGGAWIGPFVHWTGTRWVNLISANAHGIPGFAAMTALPGGRGVLLAGATIKDPEQGLIARFWPVR